MFTDTSLALIASAEPVKLADRQADTDADMVALWIGRHESPHTRRYYQRQVDALLRFASKPIASWVPNEAEQAVLARIREMKASGVRSCLTRHRRAATEAP